MTIKEKGKPGPPKGTPTSRTARYESERVKDRNAHYRPYRERVERFGPEYKLRYRLSRTNSRAVTGLEDFSDWDEEELERGRRRGKDGTFRGRDPKLVPKEAARELARRRIEQANQELAEHTPELVRSLLEIATGEEYDEKARVQAIKEALERTLGKAAENVQVTVDVKPWEKALQGAVVFVDSEDNVDESQLALGEGEIIDADLVEEDDDIDDPEIDWEDE